MNDTINQMLHALTPLRPTIDAEDGSHPGYTDDEIVGVLELQAARLDKSGMHGIALDIREGARRLNKLIEAARAIEGKP